MPGRRKTWIALALLAAAVFITVSLGRWQLQRADEKRAALAAVEAGRMLPPLALGPARAPGELVPWRPVRANGHWLANRTVLLENRMLAGQPGFWVVTPLALDEGGTVAVLRGWLPRPLEGPVAVETPAGAVAVQGELIPRVPRLLDLGHASLPRPWPEGEPPRAQNLDLAAYGEAAGLDLLPLAVQQTGAAADGLAREWAGPPANIDTHRGYALQWFSFAAIAAIAWGVILVRYFRP